MSNERFTQGEWRINQRPHGKVRIVGNDGQQVCLMFNSKERNDNANLIKASKDMYRALRAIIHACDDEQDYQAYKMAVDALAKADGGTS